nr:OadG family protein [candidate division Zixibacteria bacterium]
MFSEVMGFSLKFAVIGITIVFVSLALIAVAISLIRRLDDRWQKGEEKSKRDAVSKPQNIDTITLVLISAAVGTMFQGRYHIRSVRRLMPYGGAKSPWSVQGRAILHGSHVVPKKR